MEEIFMPIKDYEGYYEVSNFGRVRSLERKVNYTRSSFKTIKARYLKPGINGRGYYFVALCLNGKCKTKRVSLLVWDNFGDKLRDGTKLQVDHIDNNKRNDHINNLQLLTNRENTSKGKLFNKTNGLPTGVNWNKEKKKYVAQIQTNNKRVHLGYFDNPGEASNAYQCHLQAL